MKLIMGPPLSKAVAATLGEQWLEFIPSGNFETGLIVTRFARSSEHRQRQNQISNGAHQESTARLEWTVKNQIPSRSITNMTIIRSITGMTVGPKRAYRLG
jgi:hypothetical protein